MSYTKEQFMSALKNEAALTKRTPSATSWNKKHLKPSASAIIKRFGSWNNALSSAGLEINTVREYTKEQAISSLISVYKELGRIPTCRDWDRHKYHPSHGALTRLFGSWVNAIEASGIGTSTSAGLPSKQQFDKLCSGIGKMNAYIKISVDTERVHADLETGTVYSRVLKRRKFFTDPRPVIEIQDQSGKMRTRTALSIRKDSIAVFVHRIVAYAKFGDALFEKGLHVHHKNGDPLDNRGDNLELLSSKSHHKRNHFQGNHIVLDPETNKSIAVFKTRKLAEEYKSWKFPN